MNDLKDILNSEYKYLNDRMKAYEKNDVKKFDPNIPTIITLTLTDQIIINDDQEDTFSSIMQQTLLHLCYNVQDVRIAYGDVNELILVILPNKPTSQMWFNGNKESIISVVTSEATFESNRNRTDTTPPLIYRATSFQLPLYEVQNLMIWKQRSTMRSFINRHAKIHLTRHETDRKTPVELLSLLKTKGFELETYDNNVRRGFCVVKTFNIFESDVMQTLRNTHIPDKIKAPNGRTKWDIENEIPIFSEEPGFIDHMMESSKIKRI